ncbi:hypothetical protein Dsin_024493 [Dipteronia sinensis]|uniref:CCHC-type domain-containing protein n=1 Tax=Dipteronia sinensis TaxID=43782 RepID=A0AAD9ZVK4_9ROSI|nr:hypothetical protein Dsin_024493 [Dipteronia sinensis]
MGDGEATMMIVRYERLPNHCFRCGRLGHSMQECSVTSEAVGIGGREELHFGDWMRATGPEKLGRAVNRDVNERQLEKQNLGTEVNGEVIEKDFVFKARDQLLLRVVKRYQGMVGRITIQRYLMRPIIKAKRRWILGWVSPILWLKVMWVIMGRQHYKRAKE